MARLSRYGTGVPSVFDLLGHSENSLTAALGFALSRCRPLLEALLERLVGGIDLDLAADAELALEVTDKLGRTDLEIRLPRQLLICEAKQGWILPQAAQLRQYAGRVTSRGGGALVTLSQASHALAAAKLPAKIGGVDVLHLPWSDVLMDIKQVRPVCRGQERVWLDQFSNFIEGVVRVKSVADSWTYCVVLNEERTGGKRNLSFREWVTDELTYYHPYGVGGWPKDPPNFMAFRWHGAVQRIHRVIEYEVVPTLLDQFPDLPASERTQQPHAVYRLSERRLPPLEPIANGAPYRATRLWVLLDQLQIADSLFDAVQRSRELEQFA